MNLNDPNLRAKITRLIQTRADQLPPEELQALQEELDAYEFEVSCQHARVNFLAFCHLVYPNFSEGAHHRILAPLLEDIAFGRLRYLAVSIAPRHGKTEFLSYLFCAWYMGLHANKKLMMATHTASLSEFVGRRVRNLINEDIYRKIFPNTRLSPDSKSAGAWTTTENGSAHYTGVGGSIAGRGADLFVIDDPHNEQDALSSNPKAFSDTFDWYGLAFQRRQPGAAVVILHTRWAKNDLIGSVLRQAQNNPLSPQYKYIELPMELPSGKPLWADMYTEADVSEIKNAIPLHRWMSQYQQQPTSNETALVPADKWRRWSHKHPPECNYIFISLDAAIEANTRADYSVFGVFGVFKYNEHSNAVQPHEDEDDPDTLHHIILIDTVRERLEYPELKRTALRLVEAHQPDLFLIEKKASGAPLLQELRRMRIPVKPFEPVRDKHARLAQVTDLFDMGLIWAPAEYRWADEFIMEVADFPGGVNDDCVDCLSQALAHFKTGAFAPRRLQWTPETDDLHIPNPNAGYFYRIRKVS